MLGGRQRFQVAQIAAGNLAQRQRQFLAPTDGAGNRCNRHQVAIAQGLERNAQDAVLVGGEVGPGPGGGGEEVEGEGRACEHLAASAVDAGLERQCYIPAVFAHLPFHIQCHSPSLAYLTHSYRLNPGLGFLGLPRIQKQTRPRQHVAGKCHRLAPFQHIAVLVVEHAAVEVLAVLRGQLHLPGVGVGDGHLNLGAGKAVGRYRQFIRRTGETQDQRIAFDLPAFQGRGLAHWRGIQDAVLAQDQRPGLRAIFDLERQFAIRQRQFVVAGRQAGNGKRAVFQFQFVAKIHRLLAGAQFKQGGLPTGTGHGQGHRFTGSQVDHIWHHLRLVAACAAVGLHSGCLRIKADALRQHAQPHPALVIGHQTGAATVPTHAAGKIHPHPLAGHRFAIGAAQFQHGLSAVFAHQQGPGLGVAAKVAAKLCHDLHILLFPGPRQFGMRLRAHAGRAHRHRDFERNAAVGIHLQVVQAFADLGAVLQRELQIHAPVFQQADIGHLAVQIQKRGQNQVGFMAADKTFAWGIKGATELGLFFFTVEGQQGGQRPGRDHGFLQADLAVGAGVGDGGAAVFVRRPCVGAKGDGGAGHRLAVFVIHQHQVAGRAGAGKGQQAALADDGAGAVAVADQFDHISAGFFEFVEFDCFGMAQERPLAGKIHFAFNGGNRAIQSHRRVEFGALAAVIGLHVQLVDAHGQFFDILQVDFQLRHRIGGHLSQVVGSQCDIHPVAPLGELVGAHQFVDRLRIGATRGEAGLGIHPNQIIAVDRFAQAIQFFGVVEIGLGLGGVFAQEVQQFAADDRVFLRVDRRQGEAVAVEVGKGCVALAGLAGEFRQDDGAVARQGQILFEQRQIMLAVLLQGGQFVEQSGSLERNTVGRQAAAEIHQRVEIRQLRLGVAPRIQPITGPQAQGDGFDKGAIAKQIGPLLCQFTQLGQGQMLIQTALAKPGEAFHIQHGQVHHAGEIRPAKPAQALQQLMGALAAQAFAGQQRQGVIADGVQRGRVVGQQVVQGARLVEEVRRQRRRQLLHLRLAGAQVVE